VFPSHAELVQRDHGLGGVSHPLELFDILRKMQIGKGMRH
jgi:hypothetical protein